MASKEEREALLMKIKSFFSMHNISQTETLFYLLHLLSIQHSTRNVLSPASACKWNKIGQDSSRCLDRHLLVSLSKTMHLNLISYQTRLCINKQN